MWAVSAIKSRVANTRDVILISLKFLFRQQVLNFKNVFINKINIFLFSFFFQNFLNFSQKHAESCREYTHLIFIEIYC